MTYCCFPLRAGGAYGQYICHLRGGCHHLMRFLRDSQKTLSGHGEPGTRLGRYYCFSGTAGVPHPGRRTLVTLRACPDRKAELEEAGTVAGLSLGPKLWSPCSAPHLPWFFTSANSLLYSSSVSRSFWFSVSMSCSRCTLSWSCCPRSRAGTGSA